jgi:hypothetical protein
MPYEIVKYHMEYWSDNFSDTLMQNLHHLHPVYQDDIVWVRA